jgi:hypothetical protein
MSGAGANRAIATLSAVSPQLFFNPPVDIIGHTLALIAGLREDLAAVPSVVDNRVDDDAYGYKNDKNKKAASHHGLRCLPGIIADAAYYRSLPGSKSRPKGIGNRLG